MHLLRPSIDHDLIRGIHTSVAEQGTAVAISIGQLETVDAHADACFDLGDRLLDELWLTE